MITMDSADSKIERTGHSRPIAGIGLRAAVMAGVAALALTGCVASTDLAGEVSPSANGLVAPGAAVHGLTGSGTPTATPCPESQDVGAVCTTVQNNAQVFSAPNVLVPASLPVFNTFCSWPELAPGSNTLNCGTAFMAYGQYQAPAPIPPSETIAMATQNANDSNTTLTNGASCNNSQYLVCSVTGADQADPMTASFMVTNLPITVQVTNNLSASNNDTLTMQGQPQVYQMLIDPKGGNPATIAPGTSGYFGLYGSTGVINSDPESFSVRYQIGSDSNDLAGSRFLINVIIDQAAGTLDTKAGAGCTFMPGATSQSGNTYCDLSLQGAAGGPQTVIVDIHQ